MSTDQEVARIFSQNLRRFMDRDGLNQNDLVALTGASVGSVSNWLNCINVPRTGMLQRLTEIFNCQPSDLLAQPTGDTTTLPEEPVLPAEALHVAELYTVATPRDQGLVNTILEPYEAELKHPGRAKPPPAAMPKVKRRKDGFVELTVFEDQLPAAGYGSYFDTPRSHTEQYPARMVPEKATFGVPISGDSMEPRYRNHAIAFVQSAPRVESGETGLFSLNGEPYIKQLVVDAAKREVRLHSLNPAYQDIVVHEFDDLRTFGKVVGSYSIE